MTLSDPAPAPEDAAPPDAEQARVIESVAGPLLVLAPAGTGKTRAMAERLGRALEGGVAPAHCLCLTFTNRAAAEMRRRVEGVLSAPKAAEVRLCTFHGLCSWMLRAESDAAGIPGDFVVYDEQDSVELLLEVSRTGRARLGEKEAEELGYEVSRAEVLGRPRRRWPGRGGPPPAAGPRRRGAAGDRALPPGPGGTPRPGLRRPRPRGAGALRSGRRGGGAVGRALRLDPGGRGPGHPRLGVRGGGTSPGATGTSRSSGTWTRRSTSGAARTRRGSWRASSASSPRSATSP